MKIRTEQPEDHEAVAAVIEQAFGRPDEARLVERLRADGDFVLSMVAEEDGRILGHVLYSHISAPLRAVGLAPVAVLPGRQAEGIGGALIRASLERLEGEGWDAVFVLGEPAYYGRFGFSAERARGFESPYAGPYLQALAFTDPLPATSGRIDYAPAFAGLGSGP